MTLLPLPSHVAQWHSVLLDYFSTGLAGWVGCLSTQTRVSMLFSLLFNSLTSSALTERITTVPSRAEQSMHPNNAIMPFLLLSVLCLRITGTWFASQRSVDSRKASHKLHSALMNECSWLYRLMQNFLLHYNRLRGKNKKRPEIHAPVWSMSWRDTAALLLFAFHGMETWAFRLYVKCRSLYYKIPVK